MYWQPIFFSVRHDLYGSWVLAGYQTFAMSKIVLSVCFKTKWWCVSNSVESLTLLFLYHFASLSPIMANVAVVVVVVAVAALLLCAQNTIQSIHTIFSYQSSFHTFSTFLSLVLSFALFLFILRSAVAYVWIMVVFERTKKKLLLHSPCILLNERKIKHSQAGVHLFSVRAQCYIFRWASGMKVDAAERRGKEEWQNLPNRHIPLSMQYYSKMYVQSLRSLIFAAHTTPARFPIRFSICTGVCISITQSWKYASVPTVYSVPLPLYACRWQNVYAGFKSNGEQRQMNEMHRGNKSEMDRKPLVREIRNCL